MTLEQALTALYNASRQSALSADDHQRLSEIYQGSLKLLKQPEEKKKEKK